VMERRALGTLQAAAAISSRAEFLEIVIAERLCLEIPPRASDVRTNATVSQACLSRSLWEPGGTS